MKKLKYIFIVFIFTIGGCVELDETPMSTLSPDNFYKSTAQVESAFAASMNALIKYWGGYGTGYERWPQVFVHDDHAYRGNLVIPSSAGKDFWVRHYKALLNINTALFAVLDGTVENASEEEIDNLIGQAKFLRAYNYFMLVRLFGKVPLYTEGENPGINPEPRAEIAEIYELIVSDLKDAAEKLPHSWSSDAQGRPTKGTANGLLAKAYITMATAPLSQTGNYALAAAAAKKVMDSGDYSLVPDIYDVFEYENKYGPEIMWSFIGTHDDKPTDGQIWTVSEAPYYGWGDITCEYYFAEQYPEQPRKNAYLVIYNEAGDYYTEWSAAHRPGVKKYLYGPLDELYGYSMSYNIPILRFADVLLLYAEAANMSEGGPSQAAVDAVNMIIDRANGNSDGIPEARATTSMSQQEFDDMVIEERSWELCFEFDRWFDLSRKRILGDITEKSRPDFYVNFTPDDYLFPIPLIDLKLNPLLLPQNPGYPDEE